jgi:hypothetical protein
MLRGINIGTEPLHCAPCWWQQWASPKHRPTCVRSRSNVRRHKSHLHINPLKTKLFYILFKNSVRTSKRTPNFTITKINWLTLFKFKSCAGDNSSGSLWFPSTCYRWPWGVYGWSSDWCRQAKDGPRRQIRTAWHVRMSWHTNLIYSKSQEFPIWHSTGWRWDQGDQASSRTGTGAPCRDNAGCDIACRTWVTTLLHIHSIAFCRFHTAANERLI